MLCIEWNVPIEKSLVFLEFLFAFNVRNYQSANFQFNNSASPTPSPFPSSKSYNSIWTIHKKPLVSKAWLEVQCILIIINRLIQITLKALHQVAVQWENAMCVCWLGCLIHRQRHLLQIIIIVIARHCLDRCRVHTKSYVAILCEIHINLKEFPSTEE